MLLTSNKQRTILRWVNSWAAEEYIRNRTNWNGFARKTELRRYDRVITILSNDVNQFFRFIIYRQALVNQIRPLSLWHAIKIAQNDICFEREIP